MARLSGLVKLLQDWLGLSAEEDELELADEEGFLMVGGNARQEPEEEAAPVAVTPDGEDEPSAAEGGASAATTDRPAEAETEPDQMEAEPGAPAVRVVMIRADEESAPPGAVPASEAAQVAADQPPAAADPAAQEAEGEAGAEGAPSAGGEGPSGPELKEVAAGATEPATAEDDLLAVFRETATGSDYADLTKEIEDVSIHELLADLREVRELLRGALPADVSVDD